MPPAVEPYHERIAEAIRTRLAGITAGASYWYTPSKVLRTVVFDEGDLDVSHDLVILIAPGDETHREAGTGDASSGGEMAVEAEIRLLAAKRYNPATENPYQEQAPTRWTIGNRLVRDVLKALLSDVTLGGLAQNIHAKGDGIVADRARFIAGWALVELRLVVLYRYLAANP